MDKKWKIPKDLIDREDALIGGGKEGGIAFKRFGGIDGNPGF